MNAGLPHLRTEAKTQVIMPLALTVSVTLGILLIASRVSLPLLFVQLGALALGLVGMALLRQRSRPWSPTWEHGLMYLVPVLIACPLFSGFEGPRRWLPLGIHVGWLLLPMFAYLFVRKVAVEADRSGWLAATACAFVFAVQPDASMALALCSVVFVAAIVSPDALLIRLTATFAAVTGAFVSVVADSPLPPVPHVEGIIDLAFEQHLSVGCFAIAVLATLSGLPALMGARYPRRYAAAAFALTGCLAVLSLAPAFGAWPVPAIGYGASPILGIATAYGLLLRDSTHR